MPSLEKILEFSITALLFFALGYFVQNFLLSKEKEEYKNAYKGMIENFLALNVTHLHDAANLFNLIKSNSSEQNIINFATGSAYHFRSLFNSLKKSILQIREYDADDLSNATLYKLIEKEDVDLKDLINIELFQLGNFSQIEVNDNISSQYAITHGNFELLSKVFLNLVENALKYSDEKIKISLNDENNLYTVRIMSFGKSISQEISLKINNKIYDDIKGHGLSSLVDIMNYHNAGIHITSLPNEGSSITLEFKKGTEMQAKAFIVEEKTVKIQYKTPVLMAATMLVLISFYSFVKLNKTETRLVQAPVIPQEKVSSREVKPVQAARKPKPKLIAKASRSPEMNRLNSLIDMETEKLDLDLESF